MVLAILQASYASLQPSNPIIVKIVPPEEENLYDVMVGALGITGVMVVVALVAAVIFGVTLYWVRSRS